MSDGGFNFNQWQQMQQGAANKDAPPEDLSDLINKLFDKLGDWAGKLSGVNVSSFMGTGLLANADLTKAGLQVNNQIMRQSVMPDAGGGPAAQIASQVLNLKSLLQGITPPQIGEMQMANASWGDLGGFTPGPGSFPSISSGVGLGSDMGMSA